MSRPALVPFDSKPGTALLPELRMTQISHVLAMSAILGAHLANRPLGAPRREVSARLDKACQVPRSYQLSRGEAFLPLQR